MSTSTNITPDGFAAEFLDVRQLADLTHLSPATIRTKASRDVAGLPQITRIAGRLLFRRESVYAWLDGLTAAGATGAAPAAAPRRRPGRPLKGQEMRK